MKTSRKPLLGVLLASLVLAAAAPSTRADTVKQNLFHFGGDFWILQNIAIQISREPGEPGAAAARQFLTISLERCLKDCKTLDFPCDGLLDLQRRGDKLTFAEWARQLKTVREDIFKHLEKTFGRQPVRGPSAQSYFLLGQYTVAAEFTALQAKVTGQDHKKIRAFIHNMCLCSFGVRHNAKLEISSAHLQVAMAMSRLDDTSIAELNNCLRAVRDTWIRELGKAPPLAMPARPAAANGNDAAATIRGDASSVQRRNR